MTMVVLLFQGCQDADSPESPSKTPDQGR